MIDEAERDVVQIDGFVGLDAARGEALAVDQHEGAVEIQIAQIDEIFTEAALVLGVVDALRAKRWLLVQQGAEAGDAAGVDVAGAERGGADGGGFDAGCGDGDLFGLLGGGVWREAGCGEEQQGFGCLGSAMGRHGWEVPWWPWGVNSIRWLSPYLHGAWPWSEGLP